LAAPYLFTRYVFNIIIWGLIAYYLKKEFRSIKFPIDESRIESTIFASVGDYITYKDYSEGEIQYLITKKSDIDLKDIEQEREEIKDLLNILEKDTLLEQLKPEDENEKKRLFFTLKHLFFNNFISIWKPEFSFTYERVEKQGLYIIYDDGRALTPGQYLRSWNGTGYVVHDFTEFEILNADEWYHIRVDFRSAGAASYMGLSEDSFRVYLNGVPANTELSFTSVSNSVNHFLFQSGYSAYGPEFYSYLDAVGFSWDPDYNIGDNLNEGLLLSFTPDNLDWMGFSLDGQSNRTILGNTTFPFPDDGDHTIQVFGNSSLGVLYQSNFLYFSVDTTAPISDISFTPYEGVNKVNKSTTFELTADDGIGSGVSTIMYKINNSGWIPYTVPFDLSTYDYGYYLITYYAVDIVGNVEDENALLVELVEIPSKPSKPKIFGYNILLLIGLLSIVSILLTNRFLKNKD